MAKIIMAMAQETGHINATLALAKALRARGHLVSYLAIAKCAPQIEQQGFRTLPIMSGFFAAASTSSEESPATLLKRFSESRRKVMHSRAAYDSLVSSEIDEIISRESPNLALVDPLLPAVAVATQCSGIPTLMLSTTLPLRKLPGVAPLCSSLPPATGGLTALRIQAAWARLLAKQLVLRGAAHVGWRFDRELALMREARRRKFERKRIQRASFFASQLDLPELILCPPDLEFPITEPNAMCCYVGPVIDQERHEPEFPWHRLSSDRPLVYCSLGSAPDQWPHFRRFLSSVLTAMRMRPDLQWVLSTGMKMHAEALQQAPAEAVVVPYAPQLKLLARASLMVTHAGLNSLKEAAWFGVPVIALPCMLDQKGNAARIAFHRLGRVADISRLSGAQLASAVADVLEDPAYRERARAVHEKFRQFEEKAEALDLIDAVLAGTTTTATIASGNEFITAVSSL
ncbi:MAG: hypothetical protein K0S28_463 [Paucimonas sp.]|jgi:MGT family glycosyltransferase|nr:hypothetical protein [Paucimonas sp.]